LTGRSDPQSMTMAALRKQGRLRLKDAKAGKADSVHFISLKPFSKRERRRMQRGEVDAEVGGRNEEEEEEEEEFVPRSPVALPEADTCTPILVKLGFGLSEKKKKGG